ncbi:MAG: alpha/beta fold hydrolase [Deltaproteobacteria bacterium]|nr:MAG: alpha/beta fold hydrolase [Deltaproteobacteria bacterium]
MPERRTVEVDGKQVRLLVGGSGPPLLYLHGAGADVEWLEAHDRLAARFTVHLPAHPGFDESTGLEQVDGKFDYVLHYVDLLDTLRLGAVPVVGTSLGGWVAAELAEHPLAQMMRAMTPTAIAEVPEAFAYAQLKALEASAKIGWNPYLHDPKLERRLRRVRARTLVLWGRQDGLVPLVYGERYRARIPGAVLEVLDRCGHLPPIERPAEFAEAVLRFLQ